MSVWVLHMLVPLGLFLVFLLVGVLVWRGFNGGRRFTIRRMLVIIALVAIGLRLPVWLDRPPRRNYQKLQSASHLRQIALGLLSYSNRHDEFPPGTTYDPRGVPLHGWPSLILP